MSTSNDTHDHSPDDGAVHAHISDTKFLVGIFAALIVLTVITVAVSRVDLGPANSFVAILVATMKASLVATYFMHLRHDKPFNAIIFVMSFVFLGIFLVYSLNDIDTRGQIDSANGVRVYDRNGETAPGGFTPRGDTSHGGVASPAATAAGASASPQAGAHETPAHH